ncbi:MAG: hypothetical protein WAK20_00625 [Candidatus Acidiferrum sp.]
MLIRPGSKSGPAWMRNISDSLSDPERARKILMPFWAFFVLYMFVCIGLTHFVTALVFSKEHVIESSLHFAGLPLFSYGPVAHGIIAVGGRATGIVALGGIAVGILAFGGIAVGAVAFSGLSVGLFALGGIALGWRAVGALAAGDAALGAMAIARHAFAGNGIAYGSLEASGRQREHLLG